MKQIEFTDILSQFRTEGSIKSVEPLGNGLINDTYKVKTNEAESPDYVLQRINNAVFTDVDMLQHNIKVVTDHFARSWRHVAKAISGARCCGLSTPPTAKATTWMLKDATGG